jgi:hypothetical protein
MHIHYDGKGKAHRVRISAYSIQGENGEIYMGEKQGLLEVVDGGTGQAIAATCQREKVRWEK